MSARFDCSDPEARALGIGEAAAALRRGELVVLPTDTVYGVAADAFDPAAVAGLLAAKGRGRQAPPPVLVGTVRAAEALVQGFGAAGADLIDQFWPGGLTLVCRASPTLTWDLGDTKGTVAVRMPLDPVALDLLRRTGPLAVSSANKSGERPATTADEAQAQLGDAVGVYLDGGACAGDVPSTIVDLTGTIPRLLRAGVVPIERLREVIALAVAEAADKEAAAAAGLEPGSVEAGSVEPGLEAGSVEAGSVEPGLEAGSVEPGLEAGSVEPGLEAGSVEAGSVEPGLEAGSVEPGLEAGSVEPGSVDAGPAGTVGTGGETAGPDGHVVGA